MSAELSIRGAVQQIAEEKGLTEIAIVSTIEAALAAAYRKDFGEKNQNIKVIFDLDTTKARVFDVKTVVEDALVEAARAREEAEPEAGEQWHRPIESDEEKDEVRYNPKLHISLTEAEVIKPGVKVGEEIRTELEIPGAYGRMAAQTAKQVIIQKIREAEHANVFTEYKKREHEVITATVQRRDGRSVLMDLGRGLAILPYDEQIPRERYNSGDRLRVYILSVNETPRGPEITLSRSHPEVVRQVFTMEIPEIANGLITIKGISREAGSRSKVAVEASDPNVDPIGSCVGQRGTRVQTIIGELGGEKIDIIEYSEDPIRYISNSLSPAKVLTLEIDEDNRSAVATVAEDQLSLAIGKGGQNVRLAAKLTGWRIDIRSESGELHPIEEMEEATVIKSSDNEDDMAVPFVDDQAEVEAIPSEKEIDEVKEEASAE